MSQVADAVSVAIDDARMGRDEGIWSHDCAAGVTQEAIEELSPKSIGDTASGCVFPVSQRILILAAPRKRVSIRPPVWHHRVNVAHFEVCSGPKRNTVPVRKPACKPSVCVRHKQARWSSADAHSEAYQSFSVVVDWNQDKLSLAEDP